MKRFFVSAVLLSLACAAFAQDATTSTATPLAQPTVYDSAGKQLGQLVSFDDATASGMMLFQLPVVTNPDGSTQQDVVSIRLKRFADGIKYANSVDVFYTQIDCKGDAFISSAMSFGDLVSAVDADENLIVADATGQGDVLRYQSKWARDGAGCVNSGGAIAPAIKASVATSLKGTLAPPFKVKGVGRTRIVAP